MALRAFSSEVEMQRGVRFDDLAPEDQDLTLADKVLSLYELSESVEGIGTASLLLAAVGKAWPSRRFRTAWKVLDAWRVRCPPQQAPAMMWEVAMAITAWLVMAKQPRIAFGVLACFHGLLRASEAMSLTTETLLRTPQGFVAILGQTKRGAEQKVVFTEPSIVRWMDRFLLSQKLEAGDRIMGVGFNTFQSWLRRGAAAVGLGDERWSTHSLRRGGASELARRGYHIDDILVAGRWLSLRSAREYIRRGEVALLSYRHRLTAPVWTRVSALASLGSSVFNLP